MQRSTSDLDVSVRHSMETVGRAELPAAIAAIDLRIASKMLLRRIQ
jgi:hypothetical protein